MVNKSTLCMTNLRDITQYIVEKLDLKYQVDVVYKDFTKAFDRVSHSNKLCCLFGFSNELISFFDSYLSNRPLRMITGYQSKATWSAW